MRILGLIMACLLAAPGVLAKDSGVPAGLMVKIIMAAVAYDRSIEDRFGETVEIGIVGESGRAAELKKILGGYSSKKLKGMPIEIKSIEASAIENMDLDLIFFSDSLGDDAKRWAEVCKGQKATGVSADEAGVLGGLPLGVELTNSGKPKLLINLKAAKASGSNFSAQVLKLARIVKTK